ncbi:MAG: hypothetical protein Q8P41_27940 [Pseudomonadota bacterium]|nr:hypothetical protein [Pseudomonadota bacterium]
MYVNYDPSAGDEEPNWRIRLSSGVVSVIFTGTTYFLRTYPAVRIFAAVAGWILIAAGLALPTYGVLVAIGAIRGVASLASALGTAALVPGAYLVLAGVASSPKWLVYVGELREVAERREFEEEIRKNKTNPYDPIVRIALDSKRLDEYYAINQEQARVSFYWALIAMTAGFATMVLSVVAVGFHGADPKVLTGVGAGVSLEAVGAGFLALYRRSQRLASEYSDHLIRLQRVALAVELIHQAGEQATDQQVSITRDVVKSLVRGAHSQRSGGPEIAPAPVAKVRAANA